MFKKMSTIVLLFICFVSANALNQDDITVLSLNDFHGQMLPHNDMVGAAKIATFIKHYRNNHPNLVVVAAGDNYQGTAISNLSHGKVVNEFFDEIGLEYSAIGNHDFDYGQIWLSNWQKESGVRFLAANIKQEKQGFVSWLYSVLGEDQYEPYNVAKPFGYKTFDNGKTIYFIGLYTLETPETTAEKHISNLKFTNPATAANKWVNYINHYKEHGIPKADSIVLLTHIPTIQKHDGLVFYSDERSELGNKTEIKYVAKNVGGVSALFSGHSHQYVNGYVDDLAVVQGASQGKDISILHYDCNTTSVCVVTPEVVNLSVVTQGLQDDKEVTSIINKHYESMKSKLNQVISVAPEELSNEPQDGKYNIPLSYTIADIMKKDTHSDIALQNTHGIRKSLPQGDITYSMLYEAMPFDNMINTLQIKGSDLLKLIKHSVVTKEGDQIGVFAGAKIMINGDDKVVGVMINGVPLDNNKYYKMATIDFLITGGDGFDFTNMKDYKDTGIPVRDVVKDYWEKNDANILPNWQNVKVSR